MFLYHGYIKLGLFSVVGRRLDEYFNIIFSLRRLKKIISIYHFFFPNKIKASINFYLFFRNTSFTDWIKYLLMIFSGDVNFLIKKQNSSCSIIFSEFSQLLFYFKYFEFNLIQNRRIVF